MSKDSHFTGQPVYSQVLKLLEKEKILQLSRTTPGSESYVKRFDGYQHLVVMLFGVLKHFDSLRELEIGMKAEAHKLRHLGMDYLVRRSTLAEANIRRPQEYFARVYAYLLEKYARFLADSNNSNKNNLNMEVNATKRTDLFLIDPRNIVVMEGFNVRRDFDLEELKEQIKANGVLNPVTVIPYKEDGVEKYKLVDGERRYRATMLAISEGANIPFIKALKAPKGATTEQLYIEQMMRNEGKRFSELECAIMFRRFKEEFGYSQVEIAEKFKKSPAFISKCLSLLDLPQYLQDKIATGELSAMAAREISNSYTHESDQVRAAKTALRTAKANGRATATNKEVQSSLKEAKQAKAIADALRNVWAYLDGEKMIDVDKLITLLDSTNSLHSAMKEYKKTKQNENN